MQQKICDHLNYIPIRSRLICIKQLLSWEMKPWDCIEIQIVYSFYNYNSRLPYDLDEFMEFLDSALNGNAPVSEIQIGVDIQKWKVISESNEIDECGLCFSNIDLSKEHYSLPCKHNFHSISDDCLEGTVAKWFEKNITCPLCRIIIE